MIDSPYPHGDPAPTKPASPVVVVAPRPFLSASCGCAPEIRLLVSQSIRRAQQLVAAWNVPTATAARLPPVLLLGCEEYVPCESPHAIVSVDQWRHQRLLGWEREDGVVKGVLDIPGHHFSVEKHEYVCPILAWIED